MPGALIGIASVLLTIMIVHRTIGLIGKGYDMSIAVLSTVVLGIGVDFAIYSVERFRELRADLGTSSAALEAFAEEPVRAATRNAAVIAVGFLPQLFSSLTLCVIVGIFLESIIARTSRNNTPRTSPHSSTTSMSRTQRSSSETGAARSGCHGRSRTPTACQGW